MEHRKTGLYLIIPLLILAGCKRPLDKPELSDPIFKELTQAAEAIDKGIKEDEKLLAGLKEDLKKPDLTTGERRQVLKQISSMGKKIRLMRQDQTFYKLRAESRVVYVHKIYPARYEQGLPWPDPEELAQFEANKRLRGASKNWADRVPKLNYGPEKSAPADK